MKDEYIRKQDAAGVIEKEMENYVSDIWYKSATHSALNDVNENIKSLKPADVVPVVHSRWIKTADGAECEKCGREAVYQIIDDHWQYEPFCPHCGAIMDGHREE